MTQSSVKSLQLLSQLIKSLLLWNQTTFYYIPKKYFSTSKPEVRSHQAMGLTIWGSNPGEWQNIIFSIWAVQTVSSGTLSLELKRTVREDGFSPTSTVAFKNMWSFTPLHVFMACTRTTLHFTPLCFILSQINLVPVLQKLHTPIQV